MSCGSFPTAQPGAGLPKSLPRATKTPALGLHTEGIVNNNSPGFSKLPKPQSSNFAKAESSSQLLLQSREIVSPA